MENREFRDVNDGFVNTSFEVADMVIENGRFDDTGQLIADVSGGEWLCPLCEREEEFFSTTEGVLNGQLGGADGTVVGGTISILQHRYELGPAPDFEVLDEFQYSRPEVGVFIATAD